MSLPGGAGHNYQDDGGYAEEEEALEAIRRLRILMATGDGGSSGRRATTVRRGVSSGNVAAGLPGDAALGALPEPKSVFSTLRSFLEPRPTPQSAAAAGAAATSVATGAPTSTAVAVAALNAVAEAVAWLLQWHAKQTHQGRFQGPGHAGHVVLGCLASTLPAVTDCLGSAALRSAAIAACAACASEQRAFPEIGPVLVDQLARRGLSHRDPKVRRGAAEAWPALLSAGLALDEAGKKAVVEALAAAADSLAPQNGSLAGGSSETAAARGAAMAAATVLSQVLREHPQAFARAAAALPPHRRPQANGNGKGQASAGNGYTSYVEAVPVLVPRNGVGSMRPALAHASSSLGGEPVAMGFIPLGLLERLLYGGSAGSGGDGGGGSSSGSTSGGERAAAVEQLLELLVTLPAATVAEALPHVGELAAVLGLLADDDSVSVALAALKALGAFLWAVGDYLAESGGSTAEAEGRAALLPHVEALCDVLIPKLADGRVAARHHAQAALSALARATTLPPLTPHLRGRHGLCSASWRTREGAVAVYIAGLLWDYGNGSGTNNGDLPARRRARGQPPPPRAAAAGAGRESGRERRGLCRVADAESIVSHLGALPLDPRPEVREAATEALALAQVVFGQEVDVLRLLHARGFLSAADDGDGACTGGSNSGSAGSRARAEAESVLVLRLTRPLASLPTLAADGTVEYGARRRGNVNGNGNYGEVGNGGDPAGLRFRRAAAAGAGLATSPQQARRHSADSSASHGSHGEAEVPGGFARRAGEPPGGVGGRRRPASDQQASPGKQKLGQTWAFETERPLPLEPLAATLGGGRRWRDRSGGSGSGHGGGIKDEGSGASAGASPRSWGGGAAAGGAAAAAKVVLRLPPPVRGGSGSTTAGAAAAGSGSDFSRSPASLDARQQSHLAAAASYHGHSTYPIGSGGGKARDGTPVSLRSAGGPDSSGSQPKGGAFFPEPDYSGGEGVGSDSPATAAARFSRSRHRDGHNGGGGGNAYVPSWNGGGGGGGGGGDGGSIVGGRGPTHGQFEPPALRHAIGGPAAEEGGDEHYDWPLGTAARRGRAGSSSEVVPAAAASSTPPPRRRNNLGGSYSSAAASESPNRPLDASLLTSIKKTSAQRRGTRQNFSKQQQRRQRQDTTPPRIRETEEFLADRRGEGAGNDEPANSSTEERPAGPRAASAAAAIASTQQQARRGDHELENSGREGQPPPQWGSASLPAPLRANGAGEPQTPVPVGVYDARGRRQQLETSAKQPQPLRLRGAAAQARAAATAEFLPATGDPDDRPIRPMQEPCDAGEHVTDSGNGESGMNGYAGAHNIGYREEDDRWEAPARQKFQEPKVSAATLRRRQREEEDAARQRQMRQQGDTAADAPYELSDGGLAMAGAWTEPPTAAAARNRPSRSPVPRHPAVEPPGASPSKALGAVGDAFDYLASEDFRPSPQPQQELARTLAGLGRGEWPEVFHSLNGARRLALHHGQLLLQGPHLHQLVRDVLKQCENLRSQVAKNAILALGDLWRGLGRALDAELPTAAPVLVKKLADKVEFLSEAAHCAVDDVVAHSCEGRALAAFVACAQHRSAAIRAKAAAAMHKCVLQAVAVGGASALGGPRDVDKLLSVLPLLLQDGNLESRQHSKALTLTLLRSRLLPEPTLRRAIPDTVFARLERDALTLNPQLVSGGGSGGSGGFGASSRGFAAGPARRSSGMGATSSQRLATGAAARNALGRTAPGSLGEAAGATAPLTAVLGHRAPLARERAGSSFSSDGGGSAGGNSVSSPQSGGYGGGSSDGKAGRRHGRPTGDPGAAARAAAAAAAAAPELAALPALWTRMQGSDWREREAALKEAVDLVTTHPEAFAASGKAPVLVDRLCERIADGNSRVCQLALERTPAVLAAVGPAGLEPVLTTVATALVTSAASTNKQLAALGQDALSSLVSVVDPRNLVQPLSAMATHGNTRLKLPALAVLAEITGDAYAAKPLLVLKHVVPVAVGLASESKADVRAANNGLLRALYRALRSRLVEHLRQLDPGEQQRVSQLLGL